jgi:hypothetical protein
MELPVELDSMVRVGELKATPVAPSTGANTEGVCAQTCVDRPSNTNKRKVKFVFIVISWLTEARGG